MTSAVNVTALPNFDVERDALSVVIVEPLPIGKAVVGLLEPVINAPWAGVNTADSCAGDIQAANDVSHVSVTDGLDWVGVGTAAHPLIGMPPFSNATVPDGVTVPGVDVTVETRVTPWFVTDEFPVGVASESEVVLTAIWVRKASAAVPSVESTAATANLPGVAEPMSVAV